MKKKEILMRLLMIIVLMIPFAILNWFIYDILTVRLGNNFSGSTQQQMVDVGKYLPFEEESDLVRIDTDFTVEGDLPVLDGSAALVPVYAAIIENVYPEGCVTYEGGEFSDDNYYGENFASDSAMQYQNTIRGFNALVDGTVDLFFTAIPSAEQFEYADSQGVSLECVPVGREAFIFFVNSNNPIEDMNADDIRRIYSGEYTNWNQVGGVNRPINPISRVPGSGSQTMMDYFMGDVPTGSKSPLALFGGSIGFSFRFYFETMVSNEAVKMISIDGVYPSVDNIVNGDYPLTTQFYAVYRTDNDNENVTRIVEWLTTPEGQQIIEGSGYVPYYM